MSDIRFKRLTELTTDGECNVCVHEEVCHILKALESLPIKPRFKVDFRCDKYREATGVYS